ncbi:hypothetical protein EI94DRAFT_591639 [Lactarius quietus]|nr:hypothetical protein EI94DRAFT_591639 [Lactarius quietus]
MFQTLKKGLSHGCQQLPYYPPHQAVPCGYPTRSVTCDAPSQTPELQQCDLATPSLHSSWEDVSPFCNPQESPSAIHLVKGPTLFTGQSFAQRVGSFPVSGNPGAVYILEGGQILPPFPAMRTLRISFLARAKSLCQLDAHPSKRGHPNRESITSQQCGGGLPFSGK